VKPLRILALVHEDLIPPAEPEPAEIEGAAWRMEHDVVSNLRALGHEVHVQPAGGELDPIRRAVREVRPHLSFNLLERFADVPHWDQNVVAYFELQKMKYTGCNARGLLLGRDKALTRKLLSHHRIQVAEFALVARGRAFRRPERLKFPLIVKPLPLDASIGISQASVVESEEKLHERIRFVHESVGCDALVESWIEGRELYVGVLGNRRLTALPIWELNLADLPEAARRIATERLKASVAYQKRHDIPSGPARDLPEPVVARIQRLCKRVYQVLYMNGYARIDLRLAESGRVFVIEANPNPQLAKDEGLAESAAAAGLGYGALLNRIVRLGLEWDPADAY
jgi:D-alanine-D-alanine ligase